MNSLIGERLRNGVEPTDLHSRGNECILEQVARNIPQLKWGRYVHKMFHVDYLIVKYETLLTKKLTLPA